MPRKKLPPVKSNNQSVSGEALDPDALPFDGEEDEQLALKYSINSYGADHPVDGLVKRIEARKIVAPPFQRNYVWTKKQASRFIESLLLGLPVPGVFLSREKDSPTLLIIDGRQRLYTLAYFYSGIFEPNETAFSLEDVDQRFNGKTYKTLDEDDRARLDDSIIHATIISQEEPSDDNSSIYQVFERLNTGGVKLAPQEIRACVYHGPLIEQLKFLNELPAWRSVFGKPNKYLRDQELILRYFALRYRDAAYHAPMKEFLNGYAAWNRYLRKQAGEVLTSDFEKVISVISSVIGKKAFRPERSINVAVFDAVMIGLSRRLDRGELKQPDKLLGAYTKLLNTKDFVEATSTGTSQEPKVKRRLELATEAFENLT